MGSARDEFLRRLVHASGTVLPALWILDVASWPVVAALFVMGTAIAILLEGVRLFVGLDWWIYDRLTRSYEQDNVAGYALYFVSSAAVAVGAPLALGPDVGPRVAAPAILMLTVADPVSGLLGSGELRAMKRTWVLLATFGVATLLAVPFLPWYAAILGAAAATLADGVKPTVAGYVLDDNLTIPPAAAVAMAVSIQVAMQVA
jgi:dolichol kinase